MGQMVQEKVYIDTRKAAFYWRGTHIFEVADKTELIVHDIDIPTPSLLGHYPLRFVCYVVLSVSGAVAQYLHNYGGYCKILQLVMISTFPSK